MIGQRYAELKDKGQRIPVSLKLRHAAADRLVFTKWREGIGGRLRYFVSGGAPLSPTLSYSFLGAGINILQGYGMTETCVVAANRPDDNRVGSIGKPFHRNRSRHRRRRRDAGAGPERDARLLWPS